MAVNLINSNDTTISRTDDEIKINFSSTRSTQIENIENNIEDLSENVDTLNEANVYSTTEKVVGEWIDGKPIYRKIITIGSSSSLNTEISLPTNISNLDTVVNFGGGVYFEDYFVPWNFYNWGNTSYAYIAFYRNNNIWYRIARAIDSATFIIEYTKTTD